MERTIKKIDENNIEITIIYQLKKSDLLERKQIIEDKITEERAKIDLKEQGRLDSINNKLAEFES